jgi:radical SAM superfamily enzyme YgiQ (UPF0313 family)
MIEIPNTILRPGRYIGIEPNRVIKDPAQVDVRFALCFPDIYDVGMSYYGYFLLYEIANRVDRVWCERCFAPWNDMEMYLRSRSIPLFTLESKTPLGRMDLVGFSLTYELNVTNVLNMLDLAGIPLRADQRESGPIVIGGGPLMLNPGPFERIFDLIVVGEGDAVLVDILQIMREGKGLERRDLIKEIARLDGVHSPLFRKEKVERLYIKDLDASYHAVRPPIPVVGSIHNRLNIEVSRGCGNGCRFCLAGFGYRPYRERSFAKVTAIIDEAMRATGYEEISLLSLSSGDYSALFDVISYVKDTYKGVSVSLPSLKMGTIKPEDIDLIGGIARTGFTFALESASHGMRCRLNKNIDVDAFARQLPLLRKQGWRRLKLYFMVGFPWEKEDDIWGIRDVLEPFEKEGIEVNLSVAPFIPKPHTPFQWLPMEDAQVLAEKMVMVKAALRKKRVRVKYRDVETSMIEAIISRGDEQLSPLFEYLYGQGAKLEAWREFFRPELYSQWFDMVGIAKDRYLKERPADRPLPWDFVDMSIDNSFLEEELRKAQGGHPTEDCYEGCADCGIGCDRDSFPLGVRSDEKEGAESRSEFGAGGPVDGRGLRTPVNEGLRVGPNYPVQQLQDSTRKYTFRYGKYGDARYIGHLDTMNILLRVLRSLGIRIKTHGRYHPMPNISLSDALPTGIESTCELMEAEVVGDAPITRETLQAMTALLPGGMRVYESVEGKLKDMVRECVYILISDETVDMEGLRIMREGRRHFYLWQGKGVKDIWKSGKFQRIIKTEAKRTDGV